MQYVYYYIFKASHPFMRMTYVIHVPMHSRSPQHSWWSLHGIGRKASCRLGDFHNNNYTGPCNTWLWFIHASEYVFIHVYAIIYYVYDNIQCYVGIWINTVQCTWEYIKNSTCTTTQALHMLHTYFILLCTSYKLYDCMSKKGTLEETYKSDDILLHKTQHKFSNINCAL